MLSNCSHRKICSKKLNYWVEDFCKITDKYGFNFLCHFCCMKNLSKL